MPPRLILNADDFGLTPGINRAIAELHHAGALTSATLMATGPAFDDAVAIALAHPTLGVGCHIVLTDGIPVSHPETSPRCSAPTAKPSAPRSSTSSRPLLRGNIREDDIEREALAQIQKLQRAGIDVTHLDTHKHTHLFPAVARPLLHLAERTSIGAIRNPFEPPWTAASATAALPPPAAPLSSTAFAPLPAHPANPHASVLTTDGTLGISATGNLDAATLRATPRLPCPPTASSNSAAIPATTTPTSTPSHTRLRATRDIERHALLDSYPRIISQPNAPELIHYGNLGVSGLRELGHSPQHRLRKSPLADTATW